MQSTKANCYKELFEAIKDRIENERDPIANAANTSALIYEYLNFKIPVIDGNIVANRVNWCGFYFVKPSSGQSHHGHRRHSHSEKPKEEVTDVSFCSYQLVLGPFQGKAACIRINYGDGVCGSAWKRKGSIIVPDVHKFEGHIACDDSSNSEIVVPMFNKERVVVGVLDIDSRVLANFDEEDRVGLEQIVEWFMSKSAFDWRHG